MGRGVWPKKGRLREFGTDRGEGGGPKADVIYVWPLSTTLSLLGGDTRSAGKWDDIRRSRLGNVAISFDVAPRKNKRERWETLSAKLRTHLKLL